MIKNLKLIFLLVIFMQNFLLAVGEDALIFKAMQLELFCQASIFPLHQISHNSTDGYDDYEVPFTTALTHLNQLLTAVNFECDFNGRNSFDTLIWLYRSLFGLSFLVLQKLTTRSEDDESVADVRRTIHSYDIEGFDRILQRYPEGRVFHIVVKRIIELFPLVYQKATQHPLSEGVFEGFERVRRGFETEESLGPVDRASSEEEDPEDPEYRARVTSLLTALASPRSNRSRTPQRAVSPVLGEVLTSDEDSRAPRTKLPASTVTQWGIFGLGWVRRAVGY